MSGRRRAAGAGRGRERLAAIHAPSGGRPANPGERGLCRPLTEAVGPRRRRAGALRPRGDRIVPEQGGGNGNATVHQPGAMTDHEETIGCGFVSALPSPSAPSPRFHQDRTLRINAFTLDQTIRNRITLSTTNSTSRPRNNHG